MLKKILLSMFGVLLILASLLFLTAFVAYLFQPKNSYLGPARMNAAGIVFLWVAILGAGLGGVLLLRKGNAIQSGVDDDDDFRGDYDDDDAP